MDEAAGSRWQNTNLDLLRAEFGRHRMPAIEKILGTRDKAVTETIESILWKTTAALATPLRKVRHHLQCWLHFANLYEFLRDVLYVPAEIPRDLARQFGALFDVRSVIEYVQRRHFPLCAQLSLRLSDSAGAHFSPWEDADIDVLQDGAAHVVNLYLGAMEDQSIGAFVDAISPQSRGLVELSTLASSLEDIDIAEDNLGELLSDEIRTAIVGLLGFSELARELRAAFGSTDRNVAERAGVSVAQLCAHWFAWCDDDVKQHLGDILENLASRNLAAKDTPQDTIDAIESMHSSLWAHA